MYHKIQNASKLYFNLTGLSFISWKKTALMFQLNKDVLFNLLHLIGESEVTGGSFHHMRHSDHYLVEDNCKNFGFGHGVLCHHLLSPMLGGIGQGRYGVNGKQRSISQLSTYKTSTSSLLLTFSLLICGDMPRPCY